MHKSPTQSVATFTVSAARCQSQNFADTGVIIPRITCDLPQSPVTHNPSWKHPRGLQMVDQHFGKPEKIDILLGVDAFVASLLPRKRVGAPDAPVGIETVFGWVLAGKTNSLTSTTNIATHHSSLLSGDDLL